MDILEIKKYLKEHKITYKMLAEMSGVPESTLKNIFGGFTPNPRMDTIEAIERALGINEKSPLAVQGGRGVKIPVYGEIAAGIPIEAIVVNLIDLWLYIVVFLF